MIAKSQAAKVNTAQASIQEQVEMGIADVLAQNLGDKNKVTISAVVESVRKGNKSSKANSEINGATTAEEAKELVDEIYDYFPGVIEFRGEAAEGLGNVIVEVDLNLKVISCRVGKLSDVLETDSGLVDGSEIAQFVKEIEKEEIPKSNYKKRRRISNIRSV